MVKEYYYLVKRKSDGKTFIAVGNFKVPGYRPGALYEFAPESYPYKIQTPSGRRYNISSDIRYDSKRFSVIRQELKTN